eukprot:CAMPEP_0117419696 /NCGR_PEP_ID=MMETSP0758-20121206/1198_1 /TAXON_ID=63605 /ORGANISM="Percolomonas cosmopolitus, Strain AE-1 (ATCC 50343)" /LENGTH=355 /DNA_ID=CAMNT_0005200899 /DNA_START=477 /DNA_END=1544 /DNA_ORIENTATION=-
MMDDEEEEDSTLYLYHPSSYLWSQPSFVPSDLQELMDQEPPSSSSDDSDDEEDDLPEFGSLAHTLYDTFCVIEDSIDNVPLSSLHQVVRCVQSFYTRLHDQIAHCSPVHSEAINMVAEYMKIESEKRPEFSNEQIRYPSSGRLGGLTKDTALFKDAFLYDDDDDDNNDKQLLTHSFSKELAHYVATTLLNVIKLDLLKQPEKNQQKPILIDVGSRFAPVLFYAALEKPSFLSSLIGIEFQSHFVDVCQDALVVFDRFSPSHLPIDFIAGDAFDHIDLLKTARVLVFHNVFEFFSSSTTSLQLAYQKLVDFLIDNHGQYLIMVPSLEKSLDDAKMSSTTSLSFLKRLDHPLTNDAS